MISREEKYPKACDILMHNKN